MVTFGEFNPGIGFDYEYMVSKEHGIGIHVPIVLGYAGPEQDCYSDYKHTVYYAAPGVRFHTGDGTGAVDFSTGPGILICNMHFSPGENYMNPQIQRQPFDYSLFGLIVDNSINFQKNHFLFGFHVRVGTMFEEQKDERFFINFGMHFGGRF